MHIRSTLLIACVLTAATVCATERSLIDEGWRFSQGDHAGAESPDYDDSAWRRVDLPHDWSVESPPSADEPSVGGGGFHKTGVGWYRRELPPRSDGERLRIEFDGVYGLTSVWLNGEKLGKHAYGYTPFSFDITDQARSDTPNVLAVRVDNSAQPNSRWYSGSGIYRHVWLRKCGPVAIAPNSLWLDTASLTATQAVCQVSSSIDVVGVVESGVTVVASLVEEEGEEVASASATLEAHDGTEADCHLELSVDHPRAWSPDAPHRYLLVTKLVDSAGKTIDQATQLVGLRTVSIDAEHGFLLNGEPIVLYGGNVHHDHGPLGAASYDSAERRRVRLLKEAGFNAVRTSHNPPAEAFLDACDELGLLVIDEAFDGWRKKKTEHDYGEHFDENWREDLAAMVLRDRRHPSVVLWSIGNEVYERGEESGVKLCRELSTLVREIDPTRPVTAGICGLWGAGDWPLLDPLFESLDVCGYNYEIARYATDHERLPERVMYGSETYPVDIYKSCKAVADQPWAIGDFVWTAIDYLGESAIGRPYPAGETPQKHWEADHFPWRGAACGDIDLLGERKPISHHRQIVWDRGEKLYAWVVDPAGAPWSLTPWAFEPSRASWTWGVPSGTPMKVCVASRWPKVRIELNGRTLTEQAVGEANEYLLEFSVPYEPGQLAITGLGASGEEAERIEIASAGPATALKVYAEENQSTADRQSIAYVNVQIVDERGSLQPLADRDLRFQISGPAEIVAVGNASLTSSHAYASSACLTSDGRAQVILRSLGEPGIAKLKVSAEGLPPAETNIEFLPSVAP